MITVHRKPVDLTAWHLADATAMVEALSALTALGWRGGISATETGTLRLELNADNPTRQISAQLGDWIVDDMGLRLMTGTECAANYDEVEA